MPLTTARLVEALNITSEQADQVLALMRCELSPFTVDVVEQWRQSCYHEPHEHAPETIMLAIDATIGTCGTEAIWGDSVTQPIAE